MTARRPRRHLLLLALLLFGLAAGHAAWAQALPLPQEGAGLWPAFLGLQAEMQHRLTAALRGLREASPWHAALTLGSISLLYGVLHAAGPGHGKAVISSYLLARGRSLRQGIALAWAGALAQAATAIAIVVVGAMLLSMAGFQLTRVALQAERAGYLLTLLLGLGMLGHGGWQLARLQRDAGRQEHGHGHHGHGHAHGPACGHAHLPPPVAGGRSLLAAVGVVLAVGIRPCTGALIVLVLALANGLFLAGIVAVLVMAAGTAVTVSVLAALSVQAKLALLRLMRGSERWLVLAGAAGWLVGGFLLAAIGAMMLATPIVPRPF